MPQSPLAVKICGHLPFMLFRKREIRRMRPTMNPRRAVLPPGSVWPGSRPRPAASDRPQPFGQVPRIVVSVQNHLAVRHDADHGDAAVGGSKAAPRIRAEDQRAADKIADQIPVTHQHVARLPTLRAPEVPAVGAIGLIFSAPDRLRRYVRAFAQGWRKAGNALSQKAGSHQGNTTMLSRDNLRGLHGTLHGAAVNRGGGHAAYPTRRVGSLHPADASQTLRGVFPVSNEHESSGEPAHRALARSSRPIRKREHAADRTARAADARVTVRKAVTKESAMARRTSAA